MNERTMFFLKERYPRGNKRCKAKVNTTCPPLTSSHPRVSILLLPMEILEMILRQTLESLALTMTVSEKPVYLLQKYRALTLACKPFHYVVECMSLKLKVCQPNDWDNDLRNVKIQSVSGDFFQRWSADRKTFYCSTWREVFEVFQIFSVRHLPSNVHPYGVACNYQDELGKFWHNRHINIRDLYRITRTIWEDDTEIRLRPVEYLLVLGGIIQRSQRRLDTEEMERIWKRHPTKPYKLGKILHKIWWNQIDVVSTRKWVLGDEVEFSSKRIAPEVKEWWIWPQCGISILHFSGFLSGYHEGKAWVIDAWTREVYTNFAFDPSCRKLGERSRHERYSFSPFYGPRNSERRLSAWTKRSVNRW